MKYFFRGTPDGIYFEMFGSAHFSLLMVALLGTYLICKYKDKLKRDKASNFFKKTVSITLLSQQIILYLWYIFTGFSGFSESLPLYNCRIAIICTALALLTNKNIFKNISVYWGVYGSILSLIVVEGDPFSFPHYTIVSFFVGHIFLLWGSLFLLFVDGYKLNNQNLKSVLKLTTVHHFVLLVCNIIIKSNYDYLIEPPILKYVFDLMPQLLYSLIAIITYDILILIFYFMVNILISLFNENIEVTSP